jgi:lysophospholipase L1-like esterase
MRQPRRTTAVLVLLSLLASLLTVTMTAGTANAADSIPPLQWGPVQASNAAVGNLTSPTGSVTVPCSPNKGGSDLKTYSATGTLVQDISRTSIIDSVTNCITTPAVDKNGNVYGMPYDTTSGVRGPNLLAYSGNTLKWKYPVSCTNDQPSQVAAGADGNIYATTYESDGVHLIGLTPNVASGQTQPTKVLDIKVQNDCSTIIYPYKSGIMLHGQSSGGPQFYSYAGKYLGSTTSYFPTEKLNADGRLFNYSMVATGSHHSIGVTAADSNTSQTTWTTSASTPGADAQDATLRPLPGGGVAALITEQKMLSGGIPASPSYYVKTLVILNRIGQVVHSEQLPNTDGASDTQGNLYGNTFIAADNSGKVAVVRTVNFPTGMSWPYPATVPGIVIRSYDTVAATWSTPIVMRGDNAKSGGPDGFQLDWATQDVVTMSSNTLFFDASCTGNCADYNDRLYPVTMTGLSIDYPRDAVISTVPRPATPYVALGDSFSSGEGNPPFLSGTDIPNVNMCHRSSVAYPELLSGSSSKIPALGTTGFRACSGAVSSNIWNRLQWNEGIQLDWWPDTSTQLVTTTIGGNDIKFSDFAKACVLGTCQVGSPDYNNSLNAINNTLPGALKNTYESILKYAPNAQIYVMDYPQVVAAKKTSDADDPRCLYMYNNGANTTNSPYYPWEDDYAARDIVTKLDAQISTVIRQVQGESVNYAARLHYVPVNGANSPFIGHAICDSGTSDFQNVDQAGNYNAYVFHPNASGQAAYAQLMSSAINAG